MNSTETLEEIVAPLLTWFSDNARQLPWRDSPTPYQVWVSEIMLQQTRVEAVKEYYLRFMKRLPTIEALAQIEEQELLKLWEGLGYYNRVRNMQKTACIITKDYGGTFPKQYEQLLSLPGIGTYTAGAVASIAYGLPEPAVDGNVLRVLARIRGDYGDIADAAVKKRVEAELRTLLNQISDENAIPNARVPKRMNRTGALNQALMELGAIVCIPNGTPKCEMCPIRNSQACRCIAFDHNSQSELPVKSPKKQRKIDEKTVILIMDDRRTIIRKRPSTGLLAGLYEFPNTEGYLSEKQVQEYVESMGLFCLRIERIPDATHIFTHREWHMRAYLVRIAESPDANVLIEDRKHNFVNREQIEEQYPLPTAFSKFMCYVKK